MTRIFSILAILGLYSCSTTIAMAQSELTEPPFACTVKETHNEITLCFRNDEAKAAFLKSEKGVAWKAEKFWPPGSDYSKCGTGSVLETSQCCCTYKAGCPFKIPKNPNVPEGDRVNNPDWPCCVGTCECCPP